MIPFEDTLLSLLEPDQRARLSPHLEVVSYEAGRTILVRGELLDRLYLVLHGRAEARYKTKRGPYELDLGPGDFFGETTVTEHASVSDATVRTAERGTVLASIDDRRFRELLEVNASLKHRFLERTAERREALGGAILGVCEFTLPPRA
jgi:CRP-like cAMP-binding protein